MVILIIIIENVHQFYRLKSYPFTLLAIMHYLSYEKLLFYLDNKYARSERQLRICMVEGKIKDSSVDMEH